MQFQEELQKLSKEINMDPKSNNMDYNWFQVAIYLTKISDFKVCQFRIFFSNLVKLLNHNNNKLKLKTLRKNEISVPE